MSSSEPKPTSAPTKADIQRRLLHAENRNRRLERRAAAANTENEALRREIRDLRMKNFILGQNVDMLPAAGYKARYEKLRDAMQFIRELARTEVNGIPDTPPVTLEPWVAPAWARVADTAHR